MLQHVYKAGKLHVVSDEATVLSCGEPKHESMVRSEFSVNSL